VLAVLVLVSPGIIGRMTEKNLSENIAVARIESPQITVTTEEYDRGWFTSEGRHRIEFSDRNRFPELANFVDGAGYRDMPALVLDTRIDHGLVPIASLGRDEGSVTPGLASLVSTVQLDPGNGELIDLPGRIVSRIDLDGDTTAEVLIESGSWIDGDTSIGWQGAELDILLSSTGMLSGVQGFIAPVRFSTGGRLVVSGRVDIDAEQFSSPYEFMIGSLQIESEGVSVIDAAGAEFGYTSMAIAANNEITGDKLRGQSTLDVNGVGVPGLGSIDLALKLNYSGFDAGSFTRLYAAYQAASTNNAPQDAWAAIYPSMDAELQQFLSAGGEIEIEQFNISLAQGDIASDFRLALPDSANTDAFSWPGLLLKLKASLNLRIPAAIFKMILAVQPGVNTAVAMGFLVREGGDYVMSIEFAQGMAMVNGLPMPNLASLFRADR